ncbi:hypothetical protein WJX74_007804 [Apatococcus lobatus]|uniref:Uncharacterized protein n=1 Tax=Apatococcus lobatus TaxID=904363 RepID=A0AAW1QDR3_9CHLO
MGTRLVRVPQVSGLPQEALTWQSSLTGATCDDPLYKAFSASTNQQQSCSQQCSWDGCAAPLDQHGSDDCSSTSSESQEPESSGSSSHNSTGFGKGSKLDPDKSVVLAMENMSQMTLRVMVIFGTCFSYLGFALAITLIFLDGFKVLPEYHTNQMDVWSLVAGVPCLVIAIILLVAFSDVIIKCHQQGHTDEGIWQ